MNTTSSAALTSPAVTGVPLWLVLSSNTDIDTAPLFEDHRAYLRGLLEQGQLFASGPAKSTTGAMAGGITVIRAADEAEARQIMDAEPYVRAGARTYELIAWEVRHGDYHAQ